MPAFDGTGPNGIGPTGGLNGFCGGYRRNPLRRGSRRMIHSEYPVRQHALLQGAYLEHTREELIQDLTCRAELLTREMKTIQAEIEELQVKQQDNES